MCINYDDNVLAILAIGNINGKEIAAVKCAIQHVSCWKACQTSNSAIPEDVHRGILQKIMSCDARKVLDYLSLELRPHVINKLANKAMVITDLPIIKPANSKPENSNEIRGYSDVEGTFAILSKHKMINETNKDLNIAEFIDTACHEFGHLLGLRDIEGHDQCIMAAHFSNSTGIFCESCWKRFPRDLKPTAKSIHSTIK